MNEDANGPRLALRAVASVRRRLIKLPRRTRLVGLSLVVALGVGLLVPAAVVASSRSHSATTKKVALVLTTERNLGNFDPSGYQAFQAMVKKFHFSSEIAEDASYTTAPSVFADFGQRGFGLVIANSQGYQSAVLQVAKQYPNTWFVIYPDASTTGGLKNVASWVPSPYQMDYLPGAVAGLMTKTNKIGVIGSIPLPAIRSEIAGFQDAAKRVNPNVKVTTIWINSFTDVAKAKEAALSMYQGGADIVIHMADTAGLGLIQAAREQHKWAIGSFADEGKANPDVVLTSGSFNFKKHYAEMGKLFASGKLQPKLYTSTMCNDGDIMESVHHVPASVLKKVSALKQSICSGRIKLHPRLAPNP